MALQNLLGDLALEQSQQDMMLEMQALLAEMQTQQKDALTHAELMSQALNAHDHFQAAEILPRQPGNNAVLTFTFSAPVQLVYVYTIDHTNHAASVSFPPNPDPSPSFGIPLLPGVPQAFTVETDTVKVYERNGGVAVVWGYRYA